MSLLRGLGRRSWLVDDEYRDLSVKRGFKILKSFNILSAQCRLVPTPWQRAVNGQNHPWTRVVFPRSTQASTKCRKVLSNSTMRRYEQHLIVKCKPCIQPVCLYYLVSFPVVIIKVILFVVDNAGNNVPHPQVPEEPIDGLTEVMRTI